MTTLDRSELEDARFGAAAFDPATDTLPSVFPREMGPNTMKYLQEVAASGLSSDMVHRFETYLAEMHGVKHCIAAPGCTQALLSAMLGMDFDPGDEIIVSPIADYGTIAGMLFENYIPVFADAEEGTALISAKTVEPLITDRTRAILAAHVLGLPSDMAPIMALAKKHNLMVIEDVCQAILSTDNGRLAGTLGHVSCFSFDAEKTCGGDIGGAILTDDDELADRIRYRAVARGGKNIPGFGRTHFYRGFSIRLPQCAAATCLANLEILPRQIENRRRMAAMLDERLDEIPGLIPYRVPENRTHSYWMYGFGIETAAFTCTPDAFAAQLVEAGLSGAGMGRYYHMPEAVKILQEYVDRNVYPFSTPPASRQYSYSRETAPNAWAFLDTWIRWFWTEKYTPAHIEYLAGLIRDVADRNRN